MAQSAGGDQLPLSAVFIVAFFRLIKIPSIPSLAFNISNFYCIPNSLRPASSYKFSKLAITAVFIGMLEVRPRIQRLNAI